MACSDVTNGARIGCWTVLDAFAESRGNGKYKCLCRCDCGTTKLVSKDSLSRKNSLSCGCRIPFLVVERFQRHGNAVNCGRSPEYNAWTAMRQRCSNPNNPRYSLYGGRGISVCNRWHTSFEDFLDDMGPRPSPRHSIDRIDNDGDYEPRNCRWATIEEQANNKSTNNHHFYRGENLTLSQIARKYGISRRALEYRLQIGEPISAVIQYLRGL